MSWNQYIKVAEKQGFSDVELVDRGELRVLAASPSLEERRSINENQELFTKWPPSKSLEHRGVTYTVILRDDEEGRWVVGAAGSDVITVRRFKSLYVVAVGRRFSGAPDAFNRAKGIWDALEESGV